LIQDLVSGLICPACGASLDQSSRYVVHERMFRTEEPFEYLRCPNCDARVIAREPADLSRHYPRALRIEAAVGVFRRVKLALWGDATWRAVRRLRPDRRWRILDVGCGTGEFLYDLTVRGFRDVMGVDLFLPADFRDPPGVRILRRSLENVTEGPFDLITLHHVIEHTREPVAMLREVSRLLAPSGRALVRTPLADSWAADVYGAEWPQHDAPRHLVVHTERSIAAAAERAGLRVTDSWRDTGGAQVWASAYQARGSDPHDAPAWRTRLGRARYGLKAARLNREGRGDLGSFVLTHR
jgi:SAM-dependent methyltransferase